MLLADAETLILESAAIYAGQLNALGSRLAGKLAGMSDPKAILRLLKKESDRIRQATADKFKTVKRYSCQRLNV